MIGIVLKKNSQKSVLEKLGCSHLRLARRPHRPRRALHMAHKALLWVSLPIDSIIFFKQFSSTFSKRCPIKIWHVKVEDFMYVLNVN